MLLLPLKKVADAKISYTEMREDYKYKTYAVYMSLNRNDATSTDRHLTSMKTRKSCFKLIPIILMRLPQRFAGGCLPSRRPPLSRRPRPVIHWFATPPKKTVALPLIRGLNDERIPTLALKFK